MFKKVVPVPVKAKSVQFPHCDPRILHAPTECTFCDLNPGWQFLRQQWGIAFTGYQPEEKELPCPADFARGENHSKWRGNQASPGQTPGQTEPATKHPLNFKGAL